APSLLTAQFKNTPPPLEPPRHRHPSVTPGCWGGIPFGPVLSLQGRSMLRSSLATTAKFGSFFSSGSQDTAHPWKIWTEDLQLITMNCFHEITLPMDPLTQALASYTLKRAAFPHVPRSTTIVMLVAGTIADLDLL